MRHVEIQQEKRLPWEVSLDQGSYIAAVTIECGEDILFRLTLRPSGNIMPISPALSARGRPCIAPTRECVVLRYKMSRKMCSQCCCCYVYIQRSFSS